MGSDGMMKLIDGMHGQLNTNSSPHVHVVESLLGTIAFILFHVYIRAFGEFSLCLFVHI